MRVDPRPGHSATIGRLSPWGEHTTMNPTIDILRAELERLFSLDEMTSMSQRLLGLDPEDVGGATAKASFAKALTERCVDGDRIDALVDVILVSRQGVDPRVRDVAGLLGKEEIAPRQERSARSSS